MLTACWSVKGGSGTTVVAASLALVLARTTPGGVVLVDMAGDAPAVLGLPEPAGPGVSDWLAAGPEVPTDALGRLEIAVGGDLSLLPRGLAGWDGADGERLAAALSSDSRHVVVDCGSSPAPAGWAIAGAASLSLLVIRPCYLALRRAVAAPLRPSGVVLVSEPKRSLGAKDVEDVLGVPVRTCIAWDESIARVVDAGLLSFRVPRSLERAVRAAA
ncbi:MAG TPA: hypothetical protein VM030_10905 [Acidimicrobiales bacterium]|nr:hypothetical protein [Acidimicrobiales bacterium]